MSSSFLGKLAPPFFFVTNIFLVTQFSVKFSHMRKRLIPGSQSRETGYESICMAANSPWQLLPCFQLDQLL